MSRSAATTLHCDQETLVALKELQKFHLGCAKSRIINRLVLDALALKRAVNRVETPQLDVTPDA